MRRHPLTIITITLTTTILGVGCARHEAPETAAADTTVQPPAAVEATFAAFGGGARRPGSLERDREHGFEVWSAEFDGPEGGREVTALPDGTLVAIEREVASEDVPTAVRQAAERVLGTAPDELDHTRLAAYEIEDRPSPGTVRERFVDAFGNLLVTRTESDADESETPEELGDLPPAVRTAIDREAGAVPLESIVAEQADGRTVHAVSWQEADGPRELKLLDDGTVLSLELPLGAVPEAVAAQAGDEDLADQEGEVDDDESAAGVTNLERMLLDVWQVEASDGDMVRTALILPTGEILGDITVTDREHDDDED